MPTTYPNISNISWGHLQYCKYYRRPSGLALPVHKKGGPPSVAQRKPPCVRNCGRRHLDAGPVPHTEWGAGHRSKPTSSFSHSPHMLGMRAGHRFSLRQFVSIPQNQYFSYILFSLKMEPRPRTILSVNSG